MNETYWLIADEIANYLRDKMAVVDSHTELSGTSKVTYSKLGISTGDIAEAFYTIAPNLSCDEIEIVMSILKPKLEQMITAKTKVEQKGANKEMVLNLGKTILFLIGIAIVAVFISNLFN